VQLTKKDESLQRRFMPAKHADGESKQGGGLLICFVDYFGSAISRARGVHRCLLFMFIDVIFVQFKLDAVTT